MLKGMLMTFKFGDDPSPETLAWLKNKQLKPSFSYKDVWLEEHATAFTVAKAMELDILNDIRDSVLKAIAKGQTLEQFKKELTPILQKKGWWGKQLQTDPKTGIKQDAQLGSPRRLKVIYQANIRTARAAGQFQRALRTKGALPYFVYELGPSERHREHHQAMAGKIAPVDDPIWNEWMPPNGWGCKCRVRQISKREAGRKGYDGSAIGDIPRKQWKNTRTGKTESIPQGIDPGWNSNPGRARQNNLDAFLADKLESLPYGMARTAALDLVSSNKFKEMQAGKIKGNIPIAVFDAKATKALGAQSRTVLFEHTIANKMLSKHPEIKDYSIVQKAIDQGQYHKQGKDRFAVSIDHEDKSYRVVVGKGTDDQLRIISIFRQKQRNKAGLERQ